jgi:hypothetical protein
MFAIGMLIMSFVLYNYTGRGIFSLFQLYIKLKKDQDFGHVFKKSISSRTDIKQTVGSSDGITHSVKDSERYAFADWINR